MSEQCLNERRELVIKLLDEVLAAPPKAQEILEKWPDITTEKDLLIPGAWGQLHHFCNDIDIRKKDPEYEQIMLEQLAQSKAELEQSLTK